MIAEVAQGHVSQVYTDGKWLRTFPAAVRVSTVRAEFCGCCQISVSDCQLSRNGRLIGGDHSLQDLEVRPSKILLLAEAPRGYVSDTQARCVQMAGKREEVVLLTAAFRPSIAFHVWHGLTYSLAERVCLMWESETGSYVEWFGNRYKPVCKGGPFLTTYAFIVDAAPSTSVPCPTTSLTESDFQSFQLLLSMLSELLKAAKGFEADVKRLPPTLLQAYKAIMSRPGSTHCSDMRQLSDLLYPKPSALHRLGSFQNMLQFALLLLKLVTLTSSISADSANTQAAVSILWKCLQNLTDSITEHAASRGTSGTYKTDKAVGMGCYATKGRGHCIVSAAGYAGPSYLPAHT